MVLTLLRQLLHHYSVHITWVALYSLLFPVSLENSEGIEYDAVVLVGTGIHAGHLEGMAEKYLAPLSAYKEVWLAPSSSRNPKISEHNVLISPKVVRLSQTVGKPGRVVVPKHSPYLFLHAR